MGHILHTAMPTICDVEHSPSKWRKDIHNTNITRYEDTQLHRPEFSEPQFQSTKKTFPSKTAGKRIFRKTVQKGAPVGSYDKEGKWSSLGHQKTFDGCKGKTSPSHAFPKQDRFGESAAFKTRETGPAPGAYSI